MSPHDLIHLEQIGMTPVLETSRRVIAPQELLRAARIVRDAAEALAAETHMTSETSRYLLAADRIAAVLESPRPSRLRLLLTSPALTERSGQSRTLIEMIEAETSDDANRLRLAKLLFRALIWRPETFPDALD